MKGGVRNMRMTPLSDFGAERAAYRQYLHTLAADNSAFHHAFREAFFRAMREQLTARQFETLWAHEVEGKTGREIAELLGVSPSAVSRHLSRGRKRLRVLLAYNLQLQTLPGNSA